MNVDNNGRYRYCKRINFYNNDTVSVNIYGITGEISPVIVNVYTIGEFRPQTDQRSDDSNL